MKTNSRKNPVKRVFGLVARCPDTGFILARSRLPLRPVLAAIGAGSCDADLFDRFTGLKPEEIAASRVYFARFGDDPEHPAPLPEGRRAFLLDQNISYALLPRIAKMFGPSSHVEAEGLSRDNLHPAYAVHRKKLDAVILNYASTQDFAAIVTQDRDFITLFKKSAGCGTSVVLLNPADHTRVDDRLSSHRAALMNVVEDRRPRLICL